MSWKLFSFGGPLLIARAQALLTPASAQAQHHGGGHGGGFHGRGFHSLHGGNFHHAYPHHGSWGYHRYYPYYRWYGSSPYYYDTYPYTWSSPAYDSGYYNDYGDPTAFDSHNDSVAIPPTAGYQAYYPPATGPAATPDTTARITVSAPADAKLWFNGWRTTATGAIREFQSPPLMPDSLYAYEIRARWNENGHEVTQTQHVQVAAGAHVRVTFSVEPTKARTAPNQ